MSGLCWVFFSFLERFPETQSEPLFPTDQPLWSAEGSRGELTGSPLGLLWAPRPVGGAVTLGSRTASGGAS